MSYICSTEAVIDEILKPGLLLLTAVVVLRFQCVVQGIDKRIAFLQTENGSLDGGQN